MTEGACTHSLIPFTLLLKQTTCNETAAAHKAEDIQYITGDSTSSTSITMCTQVQV